MGNVVNLDDRREAKSLKVAETKLKESGMTETEIDALALLPSIGRKDIIGFVKVVGYIRGISGNGAGTIDFDLESLTIMLNDVVPEEYDDELGVETSLVLSETFRVPFTWNSLEIKEKGKTGIGDVADAFSLAIDALGDSELL